VQSTPCTRRRGARVSWFDLKTKGDEFLGLVSKPGSTVSPDLASKPVASGFSVWASKPAATV
jgi:hypothetical protein